MSVDEISRTCIRCKNDIGPGQAMEVISPSVVYHALCYSTMNAVKTLDDLPADVLDEIQDEEYINRTHGRRSTYAVGCHGPLCRKAERDRGRPRMRVLRGLDPSDMEPDTKAREDDVLLDRYLTWYIKWRERAIQAKRLGVDEYNPLYPQGFPGKTRGNRLISRKVTTDKPGA